MNAALRTIRRAVLPAFQRWNPGDVTIRHHFTGEPVRLHSFRHRGYWFFGRRREAASMQLFAEIVHAGSGVCEVGGHIGYVAQYLAHLVGATGHVWVFEPGPNNLPYTRLNLGGRDNVTLVEQGAGRVRERRPFFVEDLSGQNNSFVPDFARFARTRTRAGVPAMRARAVEVDVVPLDAFVDARGPRVDFVKIDVEGFELAVLEGARGLLTSQRPALMVEVQADHAAVFELLRGHGYRMVDPALRPARTPKDLDDNTFCFHETTHAALLARLVRDHADSGGAR